MAAEYLVGEQQHLKKFTFPRLRYVVVALATAVSATELACSFAYNFAAVCKINATVDTKLLYETNNRTSPVLYFTTKEEQYNFSAYPAGVFMGLCFILLCKSFSQLSVRWTIFFTSCLSSVVTVAIPFMYDNWSRETTIVLKVIQGLLVAPSIPLVGHVTAHWVPKQELGFHVSILTSYSQFGLFYLMATSGYLCEWFAWRGIFYFNGISGLIVSLLWVFIYRDHPTEHSWIAREELVLIHETHSTAPSKTSTVPYKQIFSNGSVWACLIAAIGNYNGVSPFIVFASMILKKALGLSDIVTSYFNAASFFMQLILKIMSGVLTDIWTAKERTKLCVFNSLSCGLCGVLCILTAFLPSNYPYLCAFLISFFQGIIGFNAAGFNKAAVIVGRQHAHVILTSYGLILTFSTFCEPALVFWLAPESTWHEWTSLFIGHGLVLVISNLLFCFLIKGTPAKFTEFSSIPLVSS